MSLFRTLVDKLHAKKAAPNAHAKVDLEGALQKGPPVETRARCVELAIEDSVPVGDRQDVRRDVLDGAAWTR